jgi:hypothetical protein
MIRLHPTVSGATASLAGLMGLCLLLFLVGQATLPGAEGIPAAPPAPKKDAKPAAPKPAEVPAHSARARAFESKGQAGTNERLGDAGNLNATVSANLASVPEIEVPGLLNARMLHAAIIGQAGQSHAEASLANLDVALGNHRITAAYIAGRADANCQRNRVSTAGRSDIVGLMVDGQPVAYRGQVNHRIAWPDGELVLNEQRGGVGGTAGHISVTALRASVKGLGEVSVGQVEAGINCALWQPCSQDFIAGSGWIAMPASRGPLHFTVAMLRNNDGGLRGQLVFADAQGNHRVTASSADEYTSHPSNPAGRLIRGLATYNGAPRMPYRLELTDGGEPGNNDRFVLILGNGYTAAGALQGGNLRLLPCR